MMDERVVQESPAATCMGTDGRQDEMREVRDVALLEGRGLWIEWRRWVGRHRHHPHLRYALSRPILVMNLHPEILRADTIRRWSDL
ncbi:uncharacterized protein STEHIDRAFT_150989 [Stereum hirsutum FP-91666 SS1]|uniref:Uncharacterized protein n=1 Tax=Stereum hirsutum (strain FP-91666) TaxID=721885 RepID=R7RWS0_STEHR|nr:uncharacterized protein STEHIDRAFT_150989 [Stereum hirsutum FP-91666 SS1]EIM79275.1 hypothetical protein STEHIDRAFT_150989 [Stereum hirsutum FP-91666 SS1]